MNYIKQISLVFFGCLIGLTLSLAVTVSGSENLAERLSGKILLQVEQNGEAWYINPTDLRRYYLGRPSDAFNVMRTLGLGVSDDDLYQITSGSLAVNNQSSSQNNNNNEINPGGRYKAHLTKSKIVNAINNNDKDEVLEYFSLEMQHAAEYTMDHLTVDQKSRWSDLIKESVFLEEKEGEVVYRSGIDFMDNTIEVNYSFKKNQEGDWQLTSI